VSSNSFSSTRGIVVHDRAGGALLSDEEPNKPEDNMAESLEQLSDTSYTSLQMDAFYMHELFTTFMCAGFTETQALRLTSYFFLEGAVGISVNIEDDDEGSDWDEEED
jgi:hypothetical protein